MKNYFVCKQTASGLYLMFGSVTKTVDKNFKHYDLIVSCAKEYNNTRDLAKREEIIKTVMDLTSDTTLSQYTEDFDMDIHGRLYLKGFSEPLPQDVTAYVKKQLEVGVDIIPIKNFIKNLLLNPNKEIRTDLFGFLNHNGHPITDMGYFLAYKAVNVKHKFDKKTGKEVVVEEYDENTGEKVKEKISQELVFTSIHKGPYGGTIKVGEPVTMPREKCNSDRNQTCSEGLHVGSMKYVEQFGGSDSVILEVLVNPRHVVSIPTDYHNTKMRVCQYYPYAISNGENQQVFLESDYADFDTKQLAEELAAYEAKRQERIKELERELEEKKRLAGGIL